MAARTGSGASETPLRPNEFLQYTLTFNAGGADMVWNDDQKTQVLSSLNFPTLSPLKWELRPTAQDGSVMVISVPENTEYSRTVPVGTLMAYGVALGFVTSTQYSLTVERRNAVGLVQTVSNFQYTGNPGDEILENLGIQV